VRERERESERKRKRGLCSAFNASASLHFSVKWKINVFIVVWYLLVLASHMLCQIVAVINLDSLSLNVKAKFFFSFRFFCSYTVACVG